MAIRLDSFWPTRDFFGGCLVARFEGHGAAQYHEPAVWLTPEM
jgi:hypothetical protein